MPPVATRLPGRSQARRFRARPTFTDCTGSSVSRLRFHSARRPAPSEDANTAGCDGDHLASHT
ncbi:hypothetical protein FBU59_005055 [Linderina macrospora]|uniref:Uncharacterized protein n=1 Tax=Linderina macrospora TaxID=4868 RepID=A0ACC1J3Y4_9FUNG|nr:hypothetical protein FBU59_005055 [Linderina macrospora]